MIKPLSLSMAFLLAIVFSSFAVSAQKGQTGQVDPAASKREQDHLGALKRCESMTGQSQEPVHRRSEKKLRPAVDALHHSGAL